MQPSLPCACLPTATTQARAHGREKKAGGQVFAKYTLFNRPTDARRKRKTQRQSRDAHHAPGEAKHEKVKKSGQSVTGVRAQLAALATASSCAHAKAMAWRQ